MTNIEKSAGMQALSGLASSPVAKLGLKYWWLAIPAGIAFWSKWKARDKHDMGTIMEDLGCALGPVFPLILLVEMMETNGKPQQVVVAGPVKDAQFTVNQPAAEPVEAGTGYTPGG